MNLSFFYGKQWVTWSSPVNGTSVLKQPKAPSWRVRLTVNKIQPYVRREMARLSSQRPRGYVMPASGEEEDRSAARVAESLLEYVSEDIGLEPAMDLSDWWTCIAGASFLKVRFTEDIDPSTNQPGKLCVDVVRPFDLYVADLEETRLKEQPWVCHVQSMQLMDIKDKFGVDVRADGGASEVDSKIRNVMSIFTQSKGDDYALVKEMWIKPCTAFPKGLVCATANGKLLPYGELQSQDDTDVTPDDPDMMQETVETPRPEGTIEWPYGHGKLPFVRRGHTMSGKFYDTSFIEQLISLQREYNRSRSQIIENKNITSRPQWAVALGSVDRNQLTTEPGAIIEYTPGFNPPQPVANPGLPNYVMEHVKVTGQEMDEIASQNAVSKGSVPPGVEAATAIAYLQERDDSALAYGIRSRERAYQEVGQQLLSLITEFWDVGRMVRVVGQNDIFDSFVLKGSDLRGNTDYRVVTGSGTPVSRAAQHAELLEMIKTGILPGAKGLKFLGMPDISQVIEEVERDIIQASKENLMMSRGQMPEVHVWHDHVAHIDEHDSFKKKEEYEHLNEQFKAIYRFHDFMHLQQLAMLFDMMPPQMAPPQTDPNNPLAVDPLMEFELRKVLMRLKAGVGAPAPSQGSAPA